MCRSLNLINQLFSAGDNNRDQCHTSIFFSLSRKPLHCMNRHFANTIIKRLRFWNFSREELHTLFHPNHGFYQNLNRSRNTLLHITKYGIFNRKKKICFKSKFPKTRKKTKMFQFKVCPWYSDINSNARFDQLGYEERLFDARTPTPKPKQNFAKLLPPSKSNFCKIAGRTHPSCDVLYFSPSSTPVGIRADSSKLNKTFNDYVMKMERRKLDRDLRPKPWRVEARTVTKMTFPSSSTKKDDATNESNQKRVCESSLETKSQRGVAESKNPSCGLTNIRQSARMSQRSSKKLQPGRHQHVVNQNSDEPRLGLVPTDWNPRNQAKYSDQANVTREMPERGVAACTESEESESRVQFISRNKINSKTFIIPDNAEDWPQKIEASQSRVKFACPCDFNALEQNLSVDKNKFVALNCSSSIYDEKLKEHRNLHAFKQRISNGAVLLEHGIPQMDESETHDKEIRRQKRESSFNETLAKRGSRQYRLDCASRLARSEKDTARSPISIREKSCTRGSILRREINNSREKVQRKPNSKTLESKLTEDQNSVIASKETDERFTESSIQRMYTYNRHSRDSGLKKDKKSSHAIRRSKEKCPYSDTGCQREIEPECLQSMDDMPGSIRLKDINDITKARAMMDAYTQFLQTEKLRSSGGSKLDGECTGPDGAHLVEKSEMFAFDNTEKMNSCNKQCTNDILSQESTFLTREPSIYSDKLIVDEVGSPSHTGDGFKANDDKHQNDRSSSLDNFIYDKLNEHRIKTSKLGGDMVHLMSNSENSDKQGDVDNRLLGRSNEQSLSGKMGRTVIRHSMPTLFLKVNQDVSKKVKSIVDSYSKFLLKEKGRTMNEPMSRNVLGCTLKHEKNVQIPLSTRGNDSALSSIRDSGQIKSLEITDSGKQEDVAEYTCSDATNYSKYLETSNKLSKSSTGSLVMGQGKNKKHFGKTSTKYKGSRIPVLTSLRKRTLLNRQPISGQAQLLHNQIGDNNVNLDKVVENNPCAEITCIDGDKCTSTWKNSSVEKQNIEQEDKASTCNKTVIKSTDCFNNRKGSVKNGRKLQFAKDLINGSKIDICDLSDLDNRIREEERMIVEGLENPDFKIIQQSDNITMSSVWGDVKETKIDEQNEFMLKPNNSVDIHRYRDKKFKNPKKLENIKRIEKSSIESVKKCEGFYSKHTDFSHKKQQLLTNTKNIKTVREATSFESCNSKTSSSTPQNKNLSTSSFKSDFSFSSQLPQEEKIVDVIPLNACSSQMLYSETNLADRKLSCTLNGANQPKSRNAHYGNDSGVVGKEVVGLNGDNHEKLCNEKETKDASIKSITEPKKEIQDSSTPSYISNRQKHSYKRPISYFDIYIKSKQLHSPSDSEEQCVKSLLEPNDKNCQTQKCPGPNELKQTISESNVDCKMSKNARNPAEKSKIQTTHFPNLTLWNDTTDEQRTKETTNHQYKTESIVTSNACNLQGLPRSKHSKSLTEDVKETDFFFDKKISNNIPDLKGSILSNHSTESSPPKFTSEYSTPSFKSTFSFSTPELKEMTSLERRVCNVDECRLPSENKCLQQKKESSNHKATFECNKIRTERPSSAATFLTPEHILPLDNAKNLREPECTIRKDRRVRFSPLLLLDNDTDSDEDTRALVDSITSSWGDESEPEHVATDILEEADGDEESKWPGRNKTSGGSGGNSYNSFMQGNKAQNKYPNDIEKTCLSKVQRKEGFKRPVENDSTAKDESFSNQSSDSTMRNIPDLDRNNLLSGSLTNSFPSNSLIMINAEEREHMAAQRSTLAALDYNYSNKVLGLSASEPCLSTSTQMTSLSVIHWEDENSVTKSVSDTILFNAYVTGILKVLQKLNDQKQLKKERNPKNSHRFLERKSVNSGYKSNCDVEQNTNRYKEITTKAAMSKRASGRSELVLVKSPCVKSCYRDQSNEFIKTCDTLSNISFLSIPSLKSNSKSELARSKTTISSTDDSPRYFPGFSEILSFWESKFGNFKALRKEAPTKKVKPCKNQKSFEFRKMKKKTGLNALGNIDLNAKCSPRSTTKTNSFVHSKQNDIDFHGKNDRKLSKTDCLNMKLKFTNLKKTPPQPSQKKRSPTIESKVKNDDVVVWKLKTFDSVSSVVALSPRKVKKITPNTKPCVKNYEEAYFNTSTGSNDIWNKKYKTKEEQPDNESRSDHAENMPRKKYSPKKTLMNGIKDAVSSTKHSIVKYIDREMKTNSSYKAENDINKPKSLFAKYQMRQECEKTPVSDKRKLVETQYPNDVPAARVAHEDKPQYLFSSPPLESIEPLASERRQQATLSGSQQRSPTTAQPRIREGVKQIVKFNTSDDEEMCYPISCGLDASPINNYKMPCDPVFPNRSKWQIPRSSFLRHKEGKRQTKAGYASNNEITREDEKQSEQSSPSIKYKSPLKQIVENSQQKSRYIKRWAEQSELCHLNTTEVYRKRETYTNQERTKKSRYTDTRGGVEKYKQYCTDNEALQFKTENSHVDEKNDHMQPDSRATEWRKDKHNPSNLKSDEASKISDTYNIQSQQHLTGINFPAVVKNKVMVQNKLNIKDRKNELDDQYHTTVNKEGETWTIRTEHKIGSIATKINERFSKMHFQPMLTVGKSPSDFSKGVATHIPNVQSATKSSSSFCCLTHSPLSEDDQGPKRLTSTIQADDDSFNEYKNIRELTEDFDEMPYKIPIPRCVFGHTDNSDYKVRNSQRADLNKLKAPKSRILQVTYRCNQDEQMTESFTTYKSKIENNKIEKNNTISKQYGDFENVTSNIQVDEDLLEQRFKNKSKRNSVAKANEESCEQRPVRKHVSLNNYDIECEMHDNGNSIVNGKSIISKDKGTSTKDLKTVGFKANMKSSHTDEDTHDKKTREEIGEPTHKSGLTTRRTHRNTQTNDEKIESMPSNNRSCDSIYKDADEIQDETSQSFKSPTQSVIHATGSETSDTFQSYLQHVKRSDLYHARRSFSDSGLTHQVCVIEKMNKTECVVGCLEDGDKCLCYKALELKKCLKDGYDPEKEAKSTSSHSKKAVETYLLNDVTDFGKTSELSLSTSKEESNETSGTRSMELDTQNSKLSNDGSTPPIKKRLNLNETMDGVRKKKCLTTEKKSAITNSQCIKPYNAGSHEGGNSLLSYVQNEEIKRWAESIENEMFDKSFKHKIYAKIRSPRKKGTEDVEIVLGSEVPVKNLVASLINDLPRSSGDIGQNYQSKSRSPARKVLISIGNSEIGHSQNTDYTFNNRKLTYVDGDESRNDSDLQPYIKDETPTPLSDSNFSKRVYRDSNESFSFEESDEQTEIQKINANANGPISDKPELPVDKLNNETYSMTIPNTSTWGTGTLDSHKTGCTHKHNFKRETSAAKQENLHFHTSQNHSKATESSGENITTDQICVMAPCSFPIKNKKVSANLSSNSITNTKKVELTFVDKKTLQSSTIYVKPSSKHALLWPKIVSKKGYVFVTFEHEESKDTNSYDKSISFQNASSKGDVSKRAKRGLNPSDKTKSSTQQQSSTKMDCDTFHERYFNKMKKLIDKEVQHTHRHKYHKILQAFDRQDNRKVAGRGTSKRSSGHRDFEPNNANDASLSTTGDDCNSSFCNSYFVDEDNNKKKKLGFNRLKQATKNGEVAQRHSKYFRHKGNDEDSFKCLDKNSRVELDPLNHTINACISPLTSPRIRKCTTNSNDPHTSSLYLGTKKRRDEVCFSNQFEKKNSNFEYASRPYGQVDDTNLLRRQTTGDPLRSPKMKTVSTSPKLNPSSLHVTQCAKENDKSKSHCEGISCIEQTSKDMNGENQSKESCLDDSNELDQGKRQLTPRQRTEVKVMDTSTSPHTSEQIQRRDRENAPTSPKRTNMTPSPETHDSFDETLNRLLQKYNRKLVSIIPEEIKEKASFSNKDTDNKPLADKLLETTGSRNEEKNSYCLQNEPQSKQSTPKNSNETGAVKYQTSIEKDRTSSAYVENLIQTSKDNHTRDESKLHGDETRRVQQLTKSKNTAQTRNEPKENVRPEKENFRKFMEYQLLKFKNSFKNQHEGKGDKEHCRRYSNNQTVDTHRETYKEDERQFYTRTVETEDQEYDLKSQFMTSSYVGSPCLSNDEKCHPRVSENAEKVVDRRRPCESKFRKTHQKRKQTKDWLQSVQNERFYGERRKTFPHASAHQERELSREPFYQEPYYFRERKYKALNLAKNSRASQMRSQNTNSENAGQDENSSREETDSSEYGIKRQDSGYVTPKLNKRKMQYEFKHLGSTSGAGNNISHFRTFLNASSNKSMESVPRQMQCDGDSCVGLLYSSNSNKRSNNEKHNRVISLKHVKESERNSGLKRDKRKQKSKEESPKSINTKPSQRTSSVGSESRHVLFSPDNSIVEYNTFDSKYSSNRGKNQQMLSAKRGGIYSINASNEDEHTPRNNKVETTPRKAIQSPWNGNLYSIKNADTPDTSAQSYKIFDKKWMRDSEIGETDSPQSPVTKGPDSRFTGKRMSIDTVSSDAGSTLSAYLERYRGQIRAEGIDDEDFKSANAHDKKQSNDRLFSKHNELNLESYRHSPSFSQIKHYKDKKPATTGFDSKRSDSRRQSNSKRYQNFGRPLSRNEGHLGDGKRSPNSIREIRLKNVGRNKRVVVSPKAKSSFKTVWKNQKSNHDFTGKSKKSMYSSDGESISTSRNRFIGRNKDFMRTNMNHRQYLKADTKRTPSKANGYKSLYREIKTKLNTSDDEKKSDDMSSIYNFDKDTRQPNKYRGRDKTSDYNYIRGYRNRDNNIINIRDRRERAENKTPICDNSRGRIDTDENSSDISESSQDCKAEGQCSKRSAERSMYYRDSHGSGRSPRETKAYKNNGRRKESGYSEKDDLEISQQNRKENETYYNGQGEVNAYDKQTTERNLGKISGFENTGTAILNEYSLMEDDIRHRDTDGDERRRNDRNSFIGDGENSGCGRGKRHKCKTIVGQHLKNRFLEGEKERKCKSIEKSSALKTIERHQYMKGKKPSNKGNEPLGDMSGVCCSARIKNQIQKVSSQTSAGGDFCHASGNRPTGCNRKPLLNVTHELDDRVKCGKKNNTANFKTTLQNFRRNSEVVKCSPDSCQETAPSTESNEEARRIPEPLSISNWDIEVLDRLRTRQQLWNQETGHFIFTNRSDTQSKCSNV